jgi:hypothetical protein
VSARAYGDDVNTQSFTAGTEQLLLTSGQWSKHDPKNIISLSTSTFTIPDTFTGTVRVTVKMLMNLTGANTFTDWLHYMRSFDAGLNTRGISGYKKVASISSGSVPNGESGSPTLEHESVFEATPLEVIELKLYTNKALTIDGQKLGKYCLIEIEQA